MRVIGYIRIMTSILSASVKHGKFYSLKYFALKQGMRLDFETLFENYRCMF
jgi:hypothetical protein